MAPLSQRNTGARRYSIDQLLGMRNSLLIVNCPVEQINQQLNIVEKRLPESSEDSEYQDHRKSGNRSIHEQSTGWHLRARTSFDTRRTFDNQVQPHSAPTNAATHQAENFRRFYRAVVSPTHVRVTAGGRIVPNTRATAPPTFDPMPDQLSISASKRSNDLDQVDKAKSTMSGSGDYLQGRNIVDGNPSLDEYSASFQPPFLPSYNYLPQGSSMSMATMSHPIDGKFYHRANATGSSRVSGAGSGGHIEHHLHYLRQHLMSLDNHIANHSLQDDYHASNQRQTLIDEISRLKSLLQAAQNPSHNFQAPKNHVPSTTNAHDSLSSQASEDHHKPISTTAGISNINTNMNDQTYSGYTSQPVPSVQSIDSPSPQEYMSKKFSTPIVGSRLPATAAMAPPFQPRSQAPLTAAQMEVFAMTSPGRNSPPATPESQLERQQRLLNRAETRWDDSAVGTSLVSMPRSQTMHAPSYQNRPVPVPAFRRSDTYPICSSELHAITNAPKVASQAARVLPSAVPYLRGHLTDVGGTGHGKYSGFEYCRPLTEAENTAREIYFGTNTQNKSTRDLPKFDGQDFYPPSPVRGSSTIPTTRGGGKSVMDWDTHCKNLFLTPQKAQTSPPSPVRATASSQALAATAERSFSDKFSFQAGERRFGSTDTSHRPISEPSGTFTSEFLANLFVKPDTQETAYNVFQKGQRGSGSTAPSILEASCDADVEATHIGESRSGASNDEVSRRGTMKNPNFSTLFTDPNWGKSDENLSNDPPVEHHEKVLSSDKVACSLESDSPEKAFLRNIINEAAMSAHEAPLTIQPNILASDDFTPVETYGIPSEHGSSIKSHSSFKRTSIYPPVTEDGSPKRRPSFAQRIASTNSSDQKPQSFLSMLKLNVSRAPVAAPAYVSSNNAQGSFHPQHRGSAVASLAPAMVNVATTPRISGSATPLSPRIYDYPVTPENRNHLRYDPVLHRSPEALAAEDYASYLKGSARAKETR
ncbi:kinase subdomain-containing protein [Rutstroemia sp. NJR-2017a WRK4]|nr:kinase subdomain-containing protein [Rutstroemia sp. NJR-2017a WRK4]